MKLELTPNQREVYAFIEGFMAIKRYPPTRHEIRDAFGFKSVNAVTQYLLALEKKRWVKVLPRISRGIVLQ